MKTVLRRHWVIALAAALLLLAVAGVALAPWWVDLGPVRAKIERAASSALAGTLTYDRMELSWFPRAEVVVHGVRLSMPGVRGTARSVDVQPALGALLRGRVVLTRLRVEGLDVAVTAGSSKEPKPASPPPHDWTQTLRSLGSQSVDVELGRSRVVLSRPSGKSLAFEGVRLEASLRSAEGKAGFTLSRLSADSPRLLVEGSLRADAGAPSVEAAAKGSALDVADVRAKLLSFAGDDAVIAEILGIVRGGTLTSFSFASNGKAPADLGALERMSIRAAVKDGKVRVPGPNLDLAGVSADVALEGGALTAENASARVGKSRVESGKVLVGLAKGDDRLRVEAQVKADLSEAPAILARVIPGRSFREEVALVEGLQGSATARIAMGDRKSAPATSVAVSDMRFSANYRRLPWPLEVRAGRFSFDESRVGVSGLEGSLGRSTFSGLAARVRLERSAFLESASGSIEVSLEDFLEGVRKSPSAAALAKSVARLSGKVRMDVRRVSGPLARPEKASVDAAGAFKEILFSFSSPSSPAPSFPPPVSIPSGRFAVSDDAIRVTDVDARTLDATLRVSGAWSGWRGGEETLEAVVEGELGPDAIDRGWEKASLPAKFRPASPIALHAVRLALSQGGALSVAGDLTVANGPRLTLDLAGDGKTIDVRGLTIADGESTASVSLLRREAAFDVAFKGSLSVSTVEKLFAAGKGHPGGVEGDVRAVVPRGNLAGLTAEGALTATKFDVPTPAGPVTIERLDVRAAKNRFDVTASSLTLDEQRFSAVGSATLAGDGIDLDMDLSTGDLSWSQVEKVLERMKEEGEKNPAAAAKPRSEPAAAPPFAVGGALRLSVDSFAYGNFVWRPVLADVQLERDSATARVRKADVCGISTTGEARFLPGGAIALDARVNAAGPDINLLLTCLGGENVRMTGSYEGSVEARGEGPAPELLRALRGPVSFKAVKGRIGKATLLTRILGVLNTTGVFAGKDKTRAGDAIPYEKLTVSGEVVDGSLSIEEAAFVAPALTMAARGTAGLLDQSLDLMVLSHPLSTVDKVVQAVPVVRKILGRDFLAVAVKVTGTIGEPKVAVTPGRDVGKGLVGILERTVTLPVTVFEPPASEAR